MPEIKLTDVTKRWGKFYAVDHLDLDIEDNAFITLLGPSGCGKTTTLRMIAGLETPTSGRITIGDQVVFDSAQGINVPPNKRKVGFLFQNYALWPNMTVYQNIAFGLNNIKEEMPEYDMEAKKTAAILAALSSPKEVVKNIEDCRDKTGKLDEKKAQLKLIDAFTLSIFGAEELFKLKLQEAADLTSAAETAKKKYEQKLESLRKNHQDKGETLDEEFAVCKGGVRKMSVRKLTKEEVDLSVRRVSRIVKIGMFMDRYPAELSGGQQQRVAIARTLAPEPQVLFMDEPLSNLDAKLRLEMRYELQRLHLETGSTFVYVTHDQMEAMTLATKICLINNGVLQQYDAPLDVYNRPNNLFVADFVGNPSINFVEAKGSQNADGTVALTVFDHHKVRFTPNEAVDLAEWAAKRDMDAAALKAAYETRLLNKKEVEKGNKDEVFRYHISKVVEDDYSIPEEVVLTNEDMVLGLRPETIEICEDGKMRGTIYGAMPTGMESTVKIAVDNYLLTGVVFGSTLFQIGEEVRFNIKGRDVLLFDRISGKCVAAGSVTVE
ncbi:MAG: ATP-binding cassette domain-containing protein [Lachnospiraceae bacterium]|nr:ATP-binding cassette domain-containing protein [Lachnospiraceae bacterium]